MRGARNIVINSFVPHWLRRELQRKYAILKKAAALSGTLWGACTGAIFSTSAHYFVWGNLLIPNSMVLFLRFWPEIEQVGSMEESYWINQIPVDVLTQSKIMQICLRVIIFRAHIMGVFYPWWVIYGINITNKPSLLNNNGGWLLKMATCLPSYFFLYKDFHIVDISVFIVESSLWMMHAFFSFLRQFMECYQKDHVHHCCQPNMLNKLQCVFLITEVIELFFFLYLENSSGFFTIVRSIVNLVFYIHVC